MGIDIQSLHRKYYEMKLFTASILTSLALVEGYQKIMLADTAEYANPLCLRQYPNGNVMLRKCRYNWNSMKWIYHLGDLASGPAGGGHLERVAYSAGAHDCLCNVADPGDSEYDAILQTCDFSGPHYGQTFVFLPTGSLDKVRIAHVGDCTCLSVPLGDYRDFASVEFEHCDPTESRQEWYVPGFSSGNMDFYEDW